MSEETALAVPVHSIGDDQLLAVAEAAERRVDAVNRIKKLSLRVTNHQDWTDQGGKPYLQVSGSEKVARLFGISWRLDEAVREEHPDGHFSYTMKGYFSMGSAEIEVVGTRSSSDPFFGGSKDRPKPVSEIDRNDVKKGAMTNCIGNGISRLLGIRNLTWEELEEAGISQAKTGKVNYKSSDPQASPTLPNYGKYKGRPMDDQAIPVDELRYYLQGAEKSIADPEKAKYKANNERMRDALKAEITKRETSSSADAVMVDAQEEQAAVTQTGPSNFIWRCGKEHNGKPIDEIPLDYLEWFAKNGKLEDHRQAAQAAIDWANGQAALDVTEGA